MKKRNLFESGTGLVSLHLIDAADVDVEPGAPLARHLPVYDAALSPRLPAPMPVAHLARGSRAAAGSFLPTLLLAAATRSTDTIRARRGSLPGRVAAAPRT